MDNMKTALIVCALVVALATDAHAAGYIKLGGVEGEASVATSTAPARGDTYQNNETDFDFVRTPASEAKGNVEHEWKVEEGEKAESESESGTGIVGDPDFDLLFVSDGEEDEERAQGLERAREALEENAKASDHAIESVTLNFEKITTRVRHEVRLLGFIPLTVTAEVDIDEAQEVKVKFPWWTFLAAGADGESLGSRVYTTISNVLKTKHDTVKNAIQNVR